MDKSKLAIVFILLFSSCFIIGILMVFFLLKNIKDPIQEVSYDPSCIRTFRKKYFPDLAIKYNSCKWNFNSEEMFENERFEPYSLKVTLVDHEGTEVIVTIKVIMLNLGKGSIPYCSEEADALKLTNKYAIISKLNEFIVVDSIKFKGDEGFLDIAAERSANNDSTKYCSQGGIEGIFNTNLNVESFLIDLGQNTQSKDGDLPLEYKYKWITYNKNAFISIKQNKLSTSYKELLEELKF